MKKLTPAAVIDDTEHGGAGVNVGVIVGVNVGVNVLVGGGGGGFVEVGRSHAMVAVGTGDVVTEGDGVCVSVGMDVCVETSIGEARFVVVANCVCVSMMDAIAVPTISCSVGNCGSDAGGNSQVRNTSPELSGLFVSITDAPETKAIRESSKVVSEEISLGEFPPGDTSVSFVTSDTI